MKEHGELTQVLVAQIKTILNADSVLGKPLEFDGMKIIPIVTIGFGFGSGSGFSERKEEGGTGGGGGGGITAQSLLIIKKDGSMEIVETQKGMLTEAIKTLMPVLMESIKTRQKGPQAPPAEPEKK
jgi:uncharacterized spore protein YtfJ